MAGSLSCNRRKSPFHRYIFLSVLAFILIGLLYHLDVIFSSGIFTSSERYIVDRLPLQPWLEDHKTDNAIQDHLLCTLELGYLKSINLTNRIKHARRFVKPLFSESLDRNVVTDISLPIIIRNGTLNLDGPCIPSIPMSIPCEPLELPVPHPHPRNQGQYTHLIFGVATTYARLRASRPTFAHWLSDSGANLVGLITDNDMDLPPLGLTALEEEYRTDGMDLTLVRKHDLLHTAEQSHTMVIRDMLRQANSAGTTETHWFGILDDDTFFPSLHALSTTLSQHDHTRPQYLGQTTESAYLLPMGILGGFGGAGVFLSLPLVRQLEPHLDGCRLGDRGGDMQLMRCVHEHSHARLGMVDGLYQMDLPGDVSGFYESGRRVLSLHHWKSWHWSPVDRMAAVARLCGDCFLQRFAFLGDDGDTLAVLSNGYSINFYEVGSGEIPDLSKTELTWDGWPGVDAWSDYQWSLGPLRPKMEKGKKKSYYLETAIHGEDGGLTQVYVHREDGKDDEVIELIWQTW